jgi:hypothetical protein
MRVKLQLVMCTNDGREETVANIVTLQKNSHGVVNIFVVLHTFGERQMRAQLITRRRLVFPLINKDLRGCLLLLTSGHVASVNPNHQKCARASIHC